MTRTPDEMFGLEVRARREEKGWSMSEFAAMLSAANLKNFHPTTVGRLERGERPVRLSEAVVIAAVLGSSLDDLAVEHVEASHRRWIQALKELRRAVLGFATERKRLSEHLERLGPPGDTVEEENLRFLQSKVAVTPELVVAETLAAHADELGGPSKEEADEILKGVGMELISEEEVGTGHGEPKHQTKA